MFKPGGLVRVGTHTGPPDLNFYENETSIPNMCADVSITKFSISMEFFQGEIGP